MSQTFYWCTSCRFEVPRGVVHCPVCAKRVIERQDARIGETLENYLIIERLAIGGMSTVYLAQHLLLRHLVAIKLMKRSYAKDAQLVQRFIREAKACCSIQHMGVPRVHECGQLDDGTLFLVMDYVEGHTLSEFLVKFGPFPWSEAAAIAIQVCDVLRTAHQQGMVHRDLKPANVMLVQDERSGPMVKVLDFGIAKLLTARSITLTGDIVGTPKYLAPEQALGRTIDARTDIYSMGILLYGMLTGTLPFVSNDSLKVIKDHISTTPVPPGPRCPELGIPDEIDAVVMTCLAKDPQQRYQRAEDLADDLVRVLVGDKPIRLLQGQIPSVELRAVQMTAQTTDWRLNPPSWVAKSFDHQTSVPFDKQVQVVGATTDVDRANLAIDNSTTETSAPVALPEIEAPTLPRVHFELERDKPEDVQPSRSHATELAELKRRFLLQPSTATPTPSSARSSSERLEIFDGPRKRTWVSTRKDRPQGSIVAIYEKATDRPEERRDDDPLSAGNQPLEITPQGELIHAQKPNQDNRPAQDSRPGDEPVVLESASSPSRAWPASTENQADTDHVSSAHSDGPARIPSEPEVASAENRRLSAPPAEVFDSKNTIRTSEYVEPCEPGPCDEFDGKDTVRSSEYVASLKEPEPPSNVQKAGPAVEEEPQSQWVRILMIIMMLVFIAAVIGVIIVMKG